MGTIGKNIEKEHYKDVDATILLQTIFKTTTCW